MDSDIRSKAEVALLQRAIPHYRIPLFKKLVEETPCKWIFYCSKHDQEISTGLRAPNLHELDVKPIRTGGWVAHFCIKAV